MSRLFEELSEGLQQAIDFERGEGTAIVTGYENSPVADILSTGSGMELPFVRVKEAQ